MNAATELKIHRAITESLKSPEGAGSDLEVVGPDRDGWLAVRGGIDLPHLVEDIAAALLEGDPSWP